MTDNTGSAFGGPCPECGELNSKRALTCVVCRAPLPWADEVAAHERELAAQALEQTTPSPTEDVETDTVEHGDGTNDRPAGPPPTSDDLNDDARRDGLAYLPQSETDADTGGETDAVAATGRRRKLGLGILIALVVMAGSYSWREAELDREAALDDASQDNISIGGHTLTHRRLVQPDFAEVVTATPNPQAAFMMTIRDGTAEQVKTMLDKGASPNSQTRRGLTALMSASFMGHNDIVALLLDRGATIEAAQPENGYTALMFAAMKDQVETIKLLVQRGAQVDAANPQGDTALTCAIYSKRVAACTALIELKANVNAKSKDGLAPLAVAAWQGPPPLVRALLDNGADANIKDSYGNTPLRYAMAAHQRAIVDMLTKAGGHV